MTNPLYVTESEASELDCPRLHLWFTDNGQQIEIADEPIDYAAILSPSIARRQAYHNLMDKGSSWFAYLSSLCSDRRVPLEQ